MTPPRISAALAQAPAGWESSLTGRFLEALLAAYHDETVRYAVLRNYERWPEHFGKDVDLVVAANDMALAERIIQRVADTFGLYVTVRRKRSSHVTYYLVAPIESQEAGIILDLRPDVVHHGLVYLPGPVVLGSRRRHADGYYIPSPAIESLAILLHTVIDTGEIRASYRARLAELGVSDPVELLAAATFAVGGRLAAELVRCLEAGEPERALPLRGRLVRACARRRPQTLVRWLGARAGAVADRVRGWVRPSGHIVILVGPDGSGKTTSAELLCQRFAETRIPVSAVYLGAQAPLLPTRRLSQQIRKRLSTAPKVKVVKDVTRRQRLRGLVHIMADKWLRYIVYVRPRLARGEVVVLDRYFYDLRTFPHPLIKRPWVEALVMRLIPEPALAFCLVADPALITARKNELTVAETERQIACYRGLSRWVRNFREMPADGDRTAVIDRMAELVLALYTSHRSPERV
ncbi:MAG: hypothetical protein E6J79_04485 [Deltaproteobacteria bacterium]|nr:MAG: hypothetical protein E6J79_04485 [Deltaproteobacteria bacterium]